MPKKKTTKKSVKEKIIKKPVKRTVNKKPVKKQVKKQPKISLELAIVSLIVNIFVPGLGTLIGGKIKDGLWQLLLLFGGFAIGTLLTVLFAVTSLVPMFFITIPLMVLAPIAAWIWGIFSGVQLIQEAQ